MKIYRIIITFVLGLSTFINAEAQKGVGINTTSITPSSVLDINSTNKGLLVPRVSLVNTLDTTTPINSPAQGLLIWNTNSTINGNGGVGFYYFDGTEWIKYQILSTLDIAYDEGGPGAGRFINADSGPVRIFGGDDFYITGTHVIDGGTGATINSEITGAGTRLFFNPRKGAFKAGRTDGDNFDDNQSRNYSFGVGYNVENVSGRGFSANRNTSTEFRGNNATAFGFESRALQNSSFALGSLNTSFGNNAFVTGSNNRGDGRHSFLLGDNNRAFSVGEAVFGVYAKNYARFDNGDDDDTDPDNDPDDSNVTNYSQDRIFAIGNGSSVTRNNALEIWKTGVIEIAEEYEIPLTDGINLETITTNGSGVATWQTQVPAFIMPKTINMYTADMPFIQTGSAWSNLPGFDIAVTPSNFSTTNNVEIKMVVHYTAKTGSKPDFRVRANSGGGEFSIINAGAGWTDTTLGTSGIVSSNWVNWSGTIPHHVMLSSRSTGGAVSMDISNAYLLIKRR